MKITADTNLLVRAIVEDHVEQAKAAQRALADAELVALTTPTLCELVWVLRRLYRMPSAAIAEAIRLLIQGDNAVIDRPEVEAGLAQLDADGDFADGAIAYEGLQLGANSFLSFDKSAVRLARQQGVQADELAW